MKVLNLWVIFFFIWLFIAVLFQKAGIYLLPELYHPLGLLKGDNLYFHELALRLLGEIEQGGISSAKIWNYHGGQGNIFVITFVYYFFGVNPLYILPVNSLIHSLSTILLFLIAYELSSGLVNQTKSYKSALLTSLLFLLFPSAVLWAAQLHKDGYAILSWLLYIYSILKIFSDNIKPALIISGLVASNFLLAFIRPHYLGLYFGITVLVFLSLVITRSIKDRKRILLFLFSILAPVVSIYLTPKVADLSPIYKSYYKSFSGSFEFEESVEIGEDLKRNVIKEFKWEPSSFFPSIVDNQLRTLSFMRFVAFRFNSDANSLLDKEVIPGSSKDLLLFLPKSLMNALFSPYPNWLLQDINIKKIVSILENILWYSVLVLVLFRFPRIIKSPPHLTCLVFALLGMVVIGVFSPTAGNIHRLRVPFQMIIVALVSGDIGNLMKRFFSREGAALKMNRGVSQKEEVKSLKKDVFKVSIITGLSFLIFFVRDLLVFKSIGINSITDQLFLGMAVPILITKSFHHTYGEKLVLSLTGPFKNRDFFKMNQILLDSTIFLFVSTLFLALCLFLLGPVLLPFFTSSTEATLKIWNLSLIILILSSLLSPLKEYLCVNGKQISAYLSTVIVPISSLLFLLLFYNQLGVSAVVLGMVIGLALNLCCVIYLTFRSSPFNFKDLKYALKLDNLDGLGPFLISSIMILSLFPFDQYLIALTEEGNLSIFTFFYKIVLFAMGVITNIMSFVVYPYFARAFGGSSTTSTSERSNFFNLCAPSFFLSSFFIVLTLLLSPVLLKNFNLLNHFDFPMNTESLQMILYYSIGQIPLLIFYFISTKFLFSIKSGNAVAFSSVISFLLNCVLSYLFLVFGEAHHILMMTNVSLLVGNLIIIYFLFKKKLINSYEAQKLSLTSFLFVTILLSQSDSLKLVLISVILLLPVVIFKKLKTLAVFNNLR